MLENGTALIPKGRVWTRVLVEALDGVFFCRGCSSGENSRDECELCRVSIILEAEALRRSNYNKESGELHCVEVSR